MVSVMDDDYVLKYVPVLTDEGKIDEFGNSEFDDLPQSNSKEMVFFEELSNDNSFNKKIDEILHAHTGHSAYADFKKRLTFYVSQKRADMKWRKDTYTRPDRKGSKRQLSSIEKALSKIDFTSSFRQQYIQEISSQLKKQRPEMSSFDRFDAAETIARFSENIVPLMQHSAQKALLEIDDTNKPKKLTEQEAHLKQKMAKVLSGMLFKFLDFKPKNTTYVENPEILDALFILCCETIGLEKVSVQSDHVQNAIKEINMRLRNKKANSAS